MFGKNDKEPDLEFYTVFDSKSRSYTEPFPGRNKEVVLRDFLNEFRKCAQDATVAARNRYFLNAEDFSLFKIGSFDLKEGRLTATNAEHVQNLHDLRALAQPVTGQGALSLT